MILMIDNYDSFTYNLVQYFAKLGERVTVVRNDKITLTEVKSMKPEGIVISPGPGNPDSAGISLELVKNFSGRLPILGVCLGHQVIGQAFGGRVVRAARLMHGKTSAVVHDGETIFNQVPTPFTAVRYHSLLVEKESLPDCLEITAWTEQGEIMGLRHKVYPVEGVQFHPESMLSEYGMDMLANFLNMVQKHKEYRIIEKVV
ncbi:glutamine amidotransferase of anthranilate synthase [Desulfofarcimen acetoxidans DSM 771]|jgi:anthranilate synthase/aminodeoxychorismate synthase-like glutamine amidotransferase|uniref:Glutamine amidotransferase of anthranilate synthase n=1 Tax=Desulfofarcimen acetoxidans (strain ATCC 49208 / DSM 771 / KCTC 5769 / VKM B-1644 / 5575) TaxID=485916 RepID=C8W334_DESAS|nr:aminodeoxychorismate/anthranilate synthase component II [Desulfofarcimen acetoxidans]ACV61801.1 glutamine amidotransferase of anthranilate synthase [Desulfofarcimen acetoxidans DSM 771]